MAKITFEMYDDEGASTEVELPAKFEVCSRCGGEGKHTNPSIDGNGLSREEFDEDPDFREAYFSGVYDVQCEECGGKRVALEIDHAACKAQGLQKELKAYYREQREIREMDAISAAERRMGA
jgi:hypothetical protein